jgi:hypothetical protein
LIQKIFTASLDLLPASTFAFDIHESHKSFPFSIQT